MDTVEDVLVAGVLQLAPQFFIQLHQLGILPFKCLLHKVRLGLGVEQTLLENLADFVPAVEDNVWLGLKSCYEWLVTHRIQFLGQQPLKINGVGNIIIVSSVDHLEEPELSHVDMDRLQGSVNVAPQTGSE